MNRTILRIQFGGLLVALIMAVALFVGPSTTSAVANDPPEAADSADVATDDKPKAGLTDDASNDTLDDQLLKELGDETSDGLDDALFEGLDDESDGQRDGTDRKPAAESADRSLDEELLRGLEGEDVEPTDEDPFARIGRQMRRAEALIGGGDTGEETQSIQLDTIAQLDDLIKAARQRMQQQSQQSSSGSQQASRRSQQQQPGSTPSDGGDGTQKQGPANDSTERLGKEDVKKIDREAMSLLLKDVWGHLPEKVREQMLQSSMEQFLPEYSLLIEEYFRRLVEERTDHP